MKNKLTGVDQMSRNWNLNLGFGLLAFITLVFWLPHVDGFNISKFAVLVFFGVLVLSNIHKWIRDFGHSDLSFIATTITFLLVLVSSSLISGNKYKSLFGETGRYTGLIAYIAGTLILIFFASQVGAQSRNTKSLITLLSILGIIEAVYAWMQYLDVDPIGWNVPYGSIIGTLANANFVGSFIGLGSVALIWTYLASSRKFVQGIFVVAVVVAQQLLLLLANVRQGNIVFIVGLTIIGLWVVRKKRIALFASLIGSSTFFIVALLGIVQKGPLDFLYKTSISVRIDYWKSALRMFNDYPFQGIGLGNFGDYFAFYRDQAQVDRSGIGTLADSAHNIFLELLVSGGVLLLVSYLSILSVITLTAIRNWERLPQDNKISLVGLTALYLGYLSQALITVETLTMIAWSSAILGLIYSVSRIKSQQSTLHTRFNFFAVIITVITTIAIVRPLWVANTLTKEAQSFRISSNTQENRTERLNLLTKATEINPRDSFYFQESARILLTGGQIEGEKFALRALELNVRDLRAATYLWGFYLQAGDEVNVQKYKEKILSLDPLASQLLNQEP